MLELLRIERKSSDPERRPPGRYRRRRFLGLAAILATLLIVVGTAQSENLEMETAGGTFTPGTFRGGAAAAPDAVVAAQREYQASRLVASRSSDAATSSEECLAGLECRNADERLTP